jgi:hypothetical protein
MNWKRAFLGALAGLVSLAICFGGSWVSAHLFFAGISFMGGGGDFTSFYVGILAIVGCMVGGLVFLARAVGARWLRSFGAAALGGVVFVLFICFLLAPGMGPGKAKLFSMLLPFVGVPAVVTVVAVWKTNGAAERAVKVVSGTSLTLYVMAMLTLAFVPDPTVGSNAAAIISALSWSMLPAIAGTLHSASWEE